MKSPLPERDSQRAGLALLLVATALAAACAEPQTRRSPRMSSQRATGAPAARTDPAAVAVDEPDLRVAISIVDEPSPADGRQICILELERDGEPVHTLGSGELITCNGVSMPFNDLVSGFAARVPTQASGGEYVFLLRLADDVRRLRVPVPDRPHLNALSSGAVLPRSANLAVEYTPAGGDEVEVVAHHADGSSATAAAQPDDGTYEGLDTSRFPPGAGTLRLARRTLSPLAAPHLGPSSSSYEVSTVIDVIWQ